MVNRGMGSANPVVTPSGLPLGSSTWATGFWFDLISQSGNQGDPLTNPISSLAGSNVLTPASSPLINDTAIGGNRGCYVLDTGISNTEPRFTCDAVASIFASAGAVWYLGADWQQLVVAANCIWNARSGTGGVNDAVRGFTQNEHIAFSWTNAAGVTTTYEGSIALAYDYHRLAWDYDGVNLRMFVDGVLDLTVAVVLPAFAVNRFTLLADRSSVVFTGSTGYARHFILSPSSVFGAGGIATVDNYLVSQNYTLALTASPKILFGGDSIQAGYAGSIQVAGTRAYILNKIQTSRLSLQAIGQFDQGTIQNRKSAAQGGAFISQVRGFLITALNAVSGLGPYLITGMAGTNDAGALSPPATMAANLLTLLDDVYALAITKNAAVKIAWSTMTPIEPGFTGEFNWGPFNTLLTQPGGVFDSCQANIAGKLIRLDNCAAIGGAWSAGKFIDQAHPNVSGDTDIGAAQWTLLQSLLTSVSPT